MTSMKNSKLYIFFYEIGIFICLTDVSLMSVLLSVTIIGVIDITIISMIMTINAVVSGTL